MFFLKKLKIVIYFLVRAHFICLIKSNCIRPLFVYLIFPHLKFRLLASERCTQTKLLFSPNVGTAVYLNSF